MQHFLSFNNPAFLCFIGYLSNRMIEQRLNDSPQYDIQIHHRFCNACICPSVQVLFYYYDILGKVIGVCCDKKHLFPKMTKQKHDPHGLRIAPYLCLGMTGTTVVCQVVAFAWFAILGFDTLHYFLHGVRLVYAAIHHGHHVQCNLM